MNASRITVLRSREDHLQALFDDGREKVQHLSESEQYQSQLEKFILEVLLLLLAPSVTLSYREQDESKVKEATAKAVEQYKQISGRETDVSFQPGIGKDS